jgi:hypothetical protein
MTNKIKELTVIGTAFAVMLSWSHNHSIFWAIVHGILDWFYVAYWIVFIYGVN